MTWICEICYKEAVRECTDDTGSAVYCQTHYMMWTAKGCSSDRPLGTKATDGPSQEKAAELKARGKYHFSRNTQDRVNKTMTPLTLINLVWRRVKADETTPAETRANAEGTLANAFEFVKKSLATRPAPKKAEELEEPDADPCIPADCYWGWCHKDDCPGSFERKDDDDDDDDEPAPTPPPTSGRDDEGMYHCDHGAGERPCPYGCNFQSDGDDDDDGHGPKKKSLIEAMGATKAVTAYLRRKAEREKLEPTPPTPPTHNAKKKRIASRKEAEELGRLGKLVANWIPTTPGEARDFLTRAGYHIIAEDRYGTGDPWYLSTADEKAAQKILDAAYRRIPKEAEEPERAWDVSIQEQSGCSFCAGRIVDNGYFLHRPDCKRRPKAYHNEVI